MTTTSAEITLEELSRDPFPVCARLRREHPVSYVPAAGRYFVTRYRDVRTVDDDPDTFSANETGSLMKRAMGHSMLRMDDPEHAVQRRSYGNVLKPKAVKQIWSHRFAENFERFFAEFTAKGPGACLVRDFAAPYAAENLRAVLGFRNADHTDLLRWSQTMIDGTGNYADDARIWALARRSYEEVDAALDELITEFRRTGDESLISHLVNAGSPEVRIEDTRANLKMTIGGGINEPRDALSTTVWALLERPGQLAAVREQGLWREAFEESVRWAAPIGMYPRQTTREVELGGTRLPSGAKLGVLALSANRDEEVFERPDEYDVFRPKTPHLAFGGGAHFCAGAWLARTQVAEIALPRLFERLPGLRLDPDRPARAAGWVFRGMTALPVRW
ncbi:cytochrome P450 [Sciscionella sediminilitoris]|uniref:cytochrome P450 n=1 Tax=Sciscionella sediminilitoris TaxID=1445613 RepID=UPI0004DEE79E|nr:cytochrome P450 [Sciscionella sp. SE31]